MFKDMEQRLDEAERLSAGLQDAINNILQMVVSVLAPEGRGSGSVLWGPTDAVGTSIRQSVNAQNKTPDTFPGPGATN